MSTPPMEHILSGQSSTPPYDLASFAGFLQSRHCLENLEFYQQLSQFLTNTPTDAQIWQGLVDRFIRFDSVSEINIPCYLKDACSQPAIPSTPVLQDLLGTVKMLLHSAYLEFVSDISAISSDSNESLESLLSKPNQSRNHSISSNGSAKEKEPSWKKNFKLKWRRSSNGSIEESA